MPINKSEFLAIPKVKPCKVAILDFKQFMEVFMAGILEGVDQRTKLAGHNRFEL